MLKGDFADMSLTIFFVFGFLILLGFLAFFNSRKVSREVRELINKKK